MLNTKFQLRYSNDGAENFGAWRDLEKGNTGDFLRPLIARRLGRTRHRVWEFRDTSPFVADILSCALRTAGETAWRDFPLPDGSYSDPTRPWSQQDVVNYLPVYAAQQGARSRIKYSTAPGLQTFANCGTGPHRGTHDVEGTLFTVSGTKLYRVEPNGTATELGTIPGVGRVCMAHNQIDGGNQLVIGNRVSGYVWNTFTETLTQITDDAFSGFAYVTFLGQYIVGVDQTRRYWYHSELNDALSYNSLDRYQAETSPDRITGIIASHNEVLVFGERSIEPWSNSPVGNAAGTAFQLNTGAVIERGCPNGNTIARLDNSVFFLGDDGKVYRLNGYTPMPVSTQAQEESWHGLDWGKAFAFTFEDAGHVVYYLTFPDGQTWGYDVPAQRWHRRETYGQNRWRLNTLVKSNGRWYGGDSRDGQLHRVEWGYTFEGADILPRSLKTGVLHADGNPIIINAIRIGLATGRISEPGGGLQDAVYTLAVSGDLPDAFIGDTANAQFSTVGGIGAVTYSLLSGTLPPGASLDDTGLITGQFIGEGDGTAYHDYTFTVKATDQTGATATCEVTTRITNFSIAGNVPDGSTGFTTSGEYNATHGIAPYTYAVTAGTFVDGLTLATDGTYSGTYSTADTFSWTVEATDANGNTATLDDTSTVSVDVLWIASNGSGKLLQSDGTDWTTNATFSVGGEKTRLTFGDGRLASAYNGDLGYSDDRGVNWTAGSADVGSGPSSPYGSRMQAIDGDFFFPTNPFALSKIMRGDGASFVAKTGDPSNANSTICIAGTAEFQVVGINATGKVAVSFDKFDTSPTVSTQFSSSGPVCGGSNGSRVMFCQPNAAKYTDDGIIWSSAATLSGFGGATCVAGSGDVWIIGGVSGIGVSVDGGNTITAATLPNTFHAFDVRYGGGLFVAVGTDGSSSEPIIFTAPLSDPFNWTLRENNYTHGETIYSVEYMGS